MNFILFTHVALSSVKLLFVICVLCVCVCDFCSEEGTALVDGSKCSSARQQGTLGICKGQQAFKPHPVFFVSLSLSLLS